MANAILPNEKRKTPAAREKYRWVRLSVSRSLPSFSPVIIPHAANITYALMNAINTQTALSKKNSDFFPSIARRQYTYRMAPYIIFVFLLHNMEIPFVLYNFQIHYVPVRFYIRVSHVETSPLLLLNNFYIDAKKQTQT